MNRPRRKPFQSLGRTVFAAACAARLVASTPAIQAAPVILIDVTNQPLSESPTPNTDFRSAFGDISGGAPTQFLIKIDNPNAFDGNYRFYTFPAGGSPDASSSWDYGDYLLKTQVWRYAHDSTRIIVDSVTYFTIPQPLPGATDSVVFGFLGPDGKTEEDPDRVPATINHQNAYTVNLGSQTYAETIVGFFGEPANTSITLNLGGTYVSNHDARLEGQQIIVQGTGAFGSKDTVFVAGNVTVNGGSLVAPTILIDNDHDYLSQTPSVGAPTYGAAAPTSTTLTLDGANAKINTTNLFVGDTSTNGSATLSLKNGASVETVILEAGNAALTDGRILIDNSTLTATSFVNVGVNGKGLLTIQNGGAMKVTGSGSNLTLGFETNSTGTITVTGSTSSLTTDGSILVGGGASSGGTATLTVSLGATVTTKDALYVGNSGAATDVMTISGGSVVTSSAVTGKAGAFSSIVGSKLFNGTAMVTISGAPSTWDSKESLSLGAHGTASITVTDGGTLQVEGSTIDIGHYEGGNGTLIFDRAGGANPTFTFAGGADSQLIIGDAGTGQVTVKGGAQIATGTDVLVGNQAAGSGQITLQDNNSSWTINATLTLGVAGSGALTIGDGGTVTVNALAFATQVGSSATLLIDGSGKFIDLTSADFTSDGPGFVTLAHDAGGGAAVTITGDVGQKLGGDGSTTLDITNGGQVEIMGRPLVLDSSSETVNVTVDGVARGGAASSLIVDNQSIIVGYSAAAKTNAAILKITGGGDVESAQSVIGWQAGSAGAVLISGVNSQWNIKVISGLYALTIGDLGTGILQVADGASFTSAGISLGANVDHSQPTAAFGKGTLAVIGTGDTGSQTSLTTNGPLTIGDFGMGTFTASAGAQIVTNGVVSIGNRTDKDAPVSSATISDPGTSWTITPAGDSIILKVLAGTLTVANGAKLDASAGTTFIGNAQVGNSTSGILTVTGDDSKATFGELGFQASRNNGTPIELKVLAGGVATGTQFTDSALSGTITIDGHSTTGSPSKLELSKSFEVLGGESLQLIVLGDGLFNLLGNQDVVGAPGNFVVRGTLRVRGGGTVQDTSGTVTIGGPTTVSESGTTIVAHKLLVGPVLSGDTPRLTIGVGASMEIGQSATIAAGGTVDLTGGGTMTIAASGYVPAAGGVLVGPEGTLKINGALNVGTPVMVAAGASVGGGGTINGTVVSGGRAAPGDPQTLTINGDYTQLPTGTLDLQIAGTGAGNADKLVVTGKATLDGYLELDFISGFAPKAGDVFSLLSFGSTVGQFSNVEVTGLAGGWTFILDPTGTTLSLTSTSNAVFQPEFLVPSGPVTILTGVTSAQTVHFLGGVLEATSNTTLFNPVILDLNGGTFQADVGTSSSLGGVISGPGTLTKTGPGSLTLTAANTYTGNTYIAEGSLFLDGSLASPNVFVELGALLGGNGTLFGNLYNAGTVSPGHSPGQIRVNGNYTQSSTGLLKIEIGGRDLFQHDLLSVGGTATLGGTLQLVRLNNFKLKRNEPVTFLTANEGVIGKFATVENGFSSDTILMPTVVYHQNSVDLEAVQGSFAHLAGLTPNQKSVGRALDGAANDPRANSLFDYLDYRQLSKLPGDFDKIAPEELTSIFTIGTSLASVQSQNIQRRTDDIRSGSGGFSAAGLAVNGTGPGYSGSFNITPGVAGSSGNDGKESKEETPVAEFKSQDWGVFLSGTGEWVSVGITDNARGYDLSSGGFTLGLDYKVTPNFAIGLAAGYTGTTADLADRGRVWVNGGKLGLYATFFQNEQPPAPTMSKDSSKDSSKEAPAPAPSIAKGFYADMAVFGGYNSYDTRRSALQGEARGSTAGGELNALFGTGYDIKKGNLTFGPTASFNYTYIGTNEFTEHGSLAPLNIHGGKGESLRTAVGFKASADWKVGGTLLKPEIRAAWQHEYGDAAYALDSSFASGAGSSFLVNGPKLGRDSALLGAGLAIQCNERISTYFYYDAELGRKNYQSNSVTGGVRIAF